jgi:hypothetical protein
MGFIGKLVEFVATKLVGRKLDLAMDEKKKACKAFLKLLDSLSELERLFSEFVKYVETLVAGRNSHIYRAHIERITSKLNDASKGFLNSLETLGPVISLYDPHLTRLLSSMMHMKLRFVLMASQFFQASNEEYSQDDSVSVEQVVETLDDRGFEHVEVSKHVVMRFDRLVVDNPNFRGLDFTLPSEELMAVDLNDVYEQSLTEPKTVRQAPPSFGTIPSTDILLNLVKDKYLEIRVGPDDIDILIDLYPTFKSHQQVLRQAIESLREFIRDNFSFEDLLYVMT